MVVFLGDYIDRGGDSRGVIDIILALRDRRDLEVRCLKGNHEQALLEFLRHPSNGEPWVAHGGRATLASYGVATNASSAEDWVRTRDALARAMPPEHLAFFASLELSIAVSDYLFVHAGVRPGVPLDQQTERDKLWIRDEFIHEAGGFDKIIVHGHTPGGAPFVDLRRICVDTGAYATGVLSAARLYAEECSFIQEGLR